MEAYYNILSIVFGLAAFAIMVTGGNPETLIILSIIFICTSAIIKEIKRE